MRDDPSGATLLFDLDGTLVDTAPDLVDSINVMLAERGHAPVPEGLVRPFIGRGARHMLERALERLGERPGADEMDRLHGAYLVHYESRIARLSRPFPGMVEALDALEARGARFAVCTNKTSGLAVRLLEELGLASRFALIAGPDTFGTAKPEPGMLLAAMEAVGARPERTVFVGDSRTDVDAARNARLPIVGVTFGYTDTPMHALAPDVLISDYAALPEAVAGLLDRSG